ncbi:MAG TPA: hypothetical protein VG944_10605, partial [Fimbriimonas sp.]|nr:hypothetical protein [Fimbriimonas sp.]
MNRKFEDQLARLAFEELQNEESSALEARVANDPEAAKVLKDFRSIKQGLRGLADIPDHQLSNERLREAVLAQGLKPHPATRTDWSWLWMCAGSAAVVVATLTFLRSSRTTAPAVMINDAAVSRDLAMGQPKFTFPELSKPMAVASRTHALASKARPVIMKAKSEPEFRTAAVRHHRRHPLNLDGGDLWYANILRSDDGSEDQPDAAGKPVVKKDAPAPLAAAPQLKPVDDKPTD